MPKSKFWATIDSTETIPIESIVSVGVITTNIGGDEYQETLIPWRRVVSVQCEEPGGIKMELGE